jgi:uncharacterized protein (DUF433 family)
MARTDLAGRLRLTSTPSAPSPIDGLGSALPTDQPAGKIASMDYRQIITIEPGKRGGKPCIRGLRITVYDVLEYLASGMTEQQILADFPDLTSDDIRACLSFAADRERKLATIPS